MRARSKVASASSSGSRTAQQCAALKAAAATALSLPPVHIPQLGVQRVSDDAFSQHFPQRLCDSVVDNRAWTLLPSEPRHAQVSGGAHSAPSFGGLEPRSAGHMRLPESVHDSLSDVLPWDQQASFLWSSTDLSAGSVQLQGLYPPQQPRSTGSLGAYPQQMPHSTGSLSMHLSHAPHSAGSLCVYSAQQPRSVGSLCQPHSAGSAVTTGFLAPPHAWPGPWGMRPLSAPGSFSGTHMCTLDDSLAQLHELMGSDEETAT